jgi:hypothetical protein
MVHIFDLYTVMEIFLTSKCVFFTTQYTSIPKGSCTPKSMNNGAITYSDSRWDECQVGREIKKIYLHLAKSY